MLTEKEKNGLIKILETLSSEDLLSLTNTTTKGMVAADSRDEAMRAIVTYTERPSHLLQRRKIKKITIFNYLRSENIIVPVTAEKLDLIKACLHFWKSQDIIKPSDLEDLEKEYQGPVNISSAPPKLTITDMGQQFTKWFYEMLNKTEDFGAHHFWPDCFMTVLVMKPNSESSTQQIQGADMVSNFFCSMISHEKLQFDPNIIGNNGIKCVEESHGLIKITVSGVVHKLYNCIGLFDQMFGLVKVPSFSNCWKIKSIQLLMKLSEERQRFEIQCESVKTM